MHGKTAYTLAMENTKYIITNKQACEEATEVILHTAGEGYVTFAEESDYDGMQYRFENPDNDEKTLFSEDYTIRRA